MKLDYRTIAYQNATEVRYLLFRLLDKLSKNEPFESGEIEVIRYDLLTHYGIFEWAFNELVNKG